MPSPSLDLRPDHLLSRHWGGGCSLFHGHFQAVALGAGRLGVLTWDAPNDRREKGSAPVPLSPAQGQVAWGGSVSWHGWALGGAVLRQKCSSAQPGELQVLTLPWAVLVGAPGDGGALLLCCVVGEGFYSFSCEGKGGVKNVLFPSPGQGSCNNQQWRIKGACK